MYGFLGLYFLLIIISLIITYFRYRRMAQANTIYTMLWSVVGILSLLNILSIEPPSVLIHKYIIISILTFNAVFLLFCRSNIKPRLNQETLYNYNINYKLLYVISIISLIVMSPHTFSAIQVIIQRGFVNVRSDIYVSVSEGSVVLAVLTRALPNAVFTAVSLIAATDLAQNKYKLLPLALLDIFLYTLTFGGRFLVLNFVVYYVVSYLFIKKNKTLKVKKIYIFSAISGLVLVTMLRAGNGMSVMEMGILYFVGSLSYLQTITTSPELYGLSSSPLYGYLTLGFIIEPIVLLLKFFLQLDIDVPSYYFNIYAQQWTNIGAGDNVIWYNNNTTMFYTFLFDFGENGIIIGTAFMAIIVCIAQNLYTKYDSLRSMFILVYMIGVIMVSTIMYSLTSLSASMIIFILLIVVKKNKIINQPLN